MALGVIFLLAIIFYVWGHLEKRNQDVVIELNLETMSELPASGAVGGE